MDDTFDAHCSLHITNFNHIGPFLRIYGHINKNSSRVLETLRESLNAVSFENLPHVPTDQDIDDSICVVKHNNNYYRAQIIGTWNIQFIAIVEFIDYGNQEMVHMRCIRYLHSNSCLAKLPPAVACFYLYGFRYINIGLDADELRKKYRELLYEKEYDVYLLNNSKHPLISLIYKGSNLAQYLIRNNFGAPISKSVQETLLSELLEDKYYLPQRGKYSIKRVYFDYNIRSTQRNLAASILHPKLNSFRRGNTIMSLPNTDIFIELPKHPRMFQTRKLCNYYEVLVMYVDPKTVNFSIRLKSENEYYCDMMAEINSRRYDPAQNLEVGQPCLAIFKDKAVIHRAKVLKACENMYTLYFVDIGAEMDTLLCNIFTIPEELIEVPELAFKFSLSGFDMQHSEHLAHNFAVFMSKNTELSLSVVQRDGPIQYAELYCKRENILLHLLRANFTKLVNWEVGESLPVVVSHVDRCAKVFVQPDLYLFTLHCIMNEVKRHCVSANDPGNLVPGTMCCALFPDDNKWYRARIVQFLVEKLKVLVTYVDYGNQQELSMDQLRTISDQLQMFPDLAKKCALVEFKDKENDKISNLLKSLTLKNKFDAHVIGKSKSTMLIELTDTNSSPPLDITSVIKERMEKD